MELAVLWVVLIALGAFVLGLVGGWSVARRARVSAAAASQADDTAADPGVGGHHIPAAAPATDDATDASAPGPLGTDMAASARVERDERARYAEIIGMETENASLRAVAARVPGLEQRIRELEAAIEERTGRSDALIDLTGSGPVPRHDDADVTSG